LETVKRAPETRAIWGRKPEGVPRGGDPEVKKEVCGKRRLIWRHSSGATKKSTEGGKKKKERGSSRERLKTKTARD